jgi:hypothetical protein
MVACGDVLRTNEEETHKKLLYINVEKEAEIKIRKRGKE